MDERTLTALKGSIHKWEQIRDGKMKDEGTKNCPLCQLFYCDECEGCPIKERTGFQNCENTPYDDMYDGEIALFVNPNPEVILAEIDFLISLLPSETKGNDQ